MSSIQDYEAIWEFTEKLPWCALVTTGRVGTDFFQSLLDSHPEIFVFNGPLRLDDFWKNSACLQSQRPVDVADLIDEFIGNFIFKFKSKYDYRERKDQLGEDMRQSIEIEIPQFREHCLRLMELKPLSFRTFLQAIYIAYELALGNLIAHKKVFLHHLHHIWRLDDYLADFPQSKIISMTRDPRATYVSGVEHWRRYNPEFSDDLKRVFFVLNRTIEDAQSLKKKPQKFMVLKLEDLGNDEILKKVCQWLGVSFHPCLRCATWAGMRWWGDLISAKIPQKSEKGFSQTMTQNNWDFRLNTIDQSVLNFLLFERLKLFSYKHQKLSKRDYLRVFFLIMWPTTYEKQAFSIKGMIGILSKHHYRTFLLNIYYYFKRVGLFYKLYYKHFRERFYLPHFD